MPLDEIQGLYPIFLSRSHVFTLCPNFIPADVCNWNYCWAMNFIQMQQYIFLLLLDLKLWILAGAHLCKFKGAHTSRLWISYTVFTVYRTFDGTSDHGNSSTKPVAYQKLMNLMTNMRCFGCSLVGKGGLELNGNIFKMFENTCDGRLTAILASRDFSLRLQPNGKFRNLDRDEGRH